MRQSRAAATVCVLPSTAASEEDVVIEARVQVEKHKLAYQEVVPVDSRRRFSFKVIVIFFLAEAGRNHIDHKIQNDLNAGKSRKQHNKARKTVLGAGFRAGMVEP